MLSNRKHIWNNNSVEKYDTRVKLNSTTCQNNDYEVNKLVLDVTACAYLEV